MAHIVNLPPGRGPPKVQAPSPRRQQSRPTQGSRGRGGKGRSNSGRGERGRGDTGGTRQQDSPTISKYQWQDFHEATDSRVETEADEDNEEDEEGCRGGETPRG